MRIKKGFELRNVCGENIVIASGMENIDFSKLICLNETAAFLWKTAEGKEFDAETLTEELMKEYEVDNETALADVKATIAQWKETGIIE